MFTHAEFPERHKRLMQDPADPIYQVCDFFLPDSVVAENERLHSSRVFAPWPDFLVAFASQGCGDYFAYDMRQAPPPVLYIDPDFTPEENLSDPETIRHLSFDDWYKCQVEASSGI